jgi:hypothetical protein
LPLTPQQRLERANRDSISLDQRFQPKEEYHEQRHVDHVGEEAKEAKQPNFDQQ